MGLSFIPNGPRCFEAVHQLLSGDAPAFLARIGGSDTGAVVSYFQDKTGIRKSSAEELAGNRSLVARYNGFYDQTNSKEVYFRYCEKLLRCYQESTQIMFCNHELLSMYFPDAINKNFVPKEIVNREGYEALVEGMGLAHERVACYPYPFVERLVFEDHTLFRVFSSVLSGKRVLVVSPFSESIIANFDKRQSFFKRNYVYPEFDLRVYDTPITYSGLPPEFYPHQDWFETLNTMKVEIAEIDFDFALLSCGSYAMPLGMFIEKELKRKAVYVGGVLQLFFGIMGRRYENPWFTDQINVENYIYPIERERYLKNTVISASMAREAFGAYF